MLETDLPFRLLDLNLLRVLDAMMAEGSVVGAAARLSITPSAVSHALGRLRVWFNDPLFVRSSSGMRATTRGAEIGTQVREGLHFLESALTPATFRAEDSTRTFTVACSAYISAVLLPGVIARMRERAPHAHLAVTPWGPGVLDRFEAGQIDALLGDFSRVPDGYGSRILFEDRLVWLTGRDYVLEPGMVDRRVLLQAEQPELADRIARENGFERRTGFDECRGILGGIADGAVLESLPYAMIAPLLVKQTDLAALVPRRLAQLFAAAFLLDAIEPALEARDGSIVVSAIGHPEYGRSAPVAWFCDLLAEAAGACDAGDSEKALLVGGGKMVGGGAARSPPPRTRGPLESKRMANCA